MKKHLIAAAVAAAVAVPAAAQVTITGNVEAGYYSAQRDTAPSGTAATVNRYTSSGIGSAIVGTPSISFRANEDLGGGLRATFQADLEYNAATGAADSKTDSVVGNNEGADLAIVLVGLSGDFGSVVLGKGAMRSRDVGGVYRFFGNQGRLASDGTNAAVALRFNSGDELNGLIEYTSPTFQGFSFSYGVAREGSINADEATAVATSIGLSAARATGFSLRGVMGPVTLQYSYETATAAAAQTSTSLTSLGGNVTLGSLRLGAVMVDTRAQGGTTGSAIGGQVAYPLMKALTVGAAYTQYKGASGSAQSTNVTTIMGKYDLSKRTAIHSSYDLVSGGVAAALIGNSRGLGVRAMNNTNNAGYHVSLVHSF